MRSLFILLLFTVQASAQAAWTCPTQDTVVLNSHQSSVISSCLVNTGFYDTLYVSATGQVTCNSGSDAALSLIVSSVQPVLGSSFIAQIASGIMTVSSMVTPFPQYGIDFGTILSDNNNGTGIPNTGPFGSNLTILGQISGTTSGVGTYTVSPSSVTVASEQMWALNNYNVKPPISSRQIRELLEHTTCTGGNNFIVTLQGQLPANQFSPNHPLWLILALTSEKFPSVKSSSWTNGQINAFTPTQFIAGGGVGGIVQ